MPILSRNRRAEFDYEILEKFEAGIELLGTEVKSVRGGHGNLAGAYVVIRGEEAWLLNAAIPPYQTKNTPPGYDAGRSRRLLLKRAELKELIGKTTQKGLTLLPLSLYTKNSRIKLELGLVRRKKKYDKREKIREREDQRKIEQALRAIR